MIIKVKVKNTRSTVAWEQLPEHNLVAHIDGGNLDEYSLFDTIANAMATAYGVGVAQGRMDDVEVRWNRQGSTQGHYIDVHWSPDMVNVPGIEEVTAQELLKAAFAHHKNHAGALYGNNFVECPQCCFHAHIDPNDKPWLWRHWGSEYDRTPITDPADVRLAGQ